MVKILVQRYKFFLTFASINTLGSLATFSLWPLSGKIFFLTSLQRLVCLLKKMCIFARMLPLLLTGQLLLHTYYYNIIYGKLV